MLLVGQLQGIHKHGLDGVFVPSCRRHQRKPAFFQPADSKGANAHRYCQGGQQNAFPFRRAVAQKDRVRRSALPDGIFRQSGSVQPFGSLPDFIAQDGEGMAEGNGNIREDFFRNAAEPFSCLAAREQYDFRVHKPASCFC